MTGPVLDPAALDQVLDARLPRNTPTFVMGQVTAIDSSGAVTVNLGGVDRAATRTLDVPLTVGDNVFCVRQRSQLTVLGPVDAYTRPITGTVASTPANSYTIVVTTAIGAVSAQFPASYTPTVGDSVLIVWAGSVPIVLGKWGKIGTPGSAPAAPGRPSTPAPPSPIPTAGTKTFHAVASGTRRGGVWRADTAGNVIQGTAPSGGSANTGAWFYGGQPRATLAGATVTAAWVWLQRVEGGTAGPLTVHLYRVTDDRRPAGDPTFTTTTNDVPLDIGQSGWWPIDTSFGQALVNSGGSVGVQGTPYVRLAGLGNTGAAGALRLQWRK